eukprot:GABV01009176.1.p1 GENE.GABV01009176.1~~GABV01009176.1.p1  ORF type:complete len:169 (-),score=49.23 GABV01009176.1:198-704(-)
MMRMLQDNLHVWIQLETLKSWRSMWTATLEMPDLSEKVREGDVLGQRMEQMWVYVAEWAICKGAGGCRVESSGEKQIFEFGLDILWEWQVFFHGKKRAAREWILKLDFRPLKRKTGLELPEDRWDELAAGVMEGLKARIGAVDSKWDQNPSRVFTKIKCLFDFLALRP